MGARAVQLLTKNKKELHMLAEALVEFETLDAEDIKLAIVGKKEEIQKRREQYKATIASYTRPKEHVEEAVAQSFAKVPMLSALVPLKRSVYEFSSGLSA